MIKFCPICPISLIIVFLFSSPANVDASVMYRRWKESKGKDKEYENIIRYGSKNISSDISKIYHPILENK